MKNVLLVLSLVSLILSASAKIEMGAPFSDGAILQRGMTVPVWGRVVPDAEDLAKPGEGGPKVALPGKRKITVSFAGQEKTVESDAVSGRWKVELDPMEASAESRTMTVIEEKQGFVFDSTVSSLEIKDVLVGEVWFASGQSNMECPIWGNNTRYRDMKGGLMTTMTHLPLVRYVKVPRAWSPAPKALQAKWSRFTADDLQLFYRVKTGLGGPNTGVSLSAVAFYYARELYLALGIPVGIVDASWGGTNIDAWTPRCGYENCDPSIQATADYKVKAGNDWKAEKDRQGPVGGPHQQPTVLWNGMVDAFAPMAMRGFIWYQGCHNSGESQLYCAKMHALYNGWSKAFANPDLKLYFVELAPYNQNWPGLCAAQEKFVDEERNAALAVTADVGNFDDIHPNDKEIIAKRLVAHALKRDYGFDIPEDCSPVFRSATFKDGQAVLSFDHVKDWYVYAPNRSREAAFEVAGTNGVWEAAKIVNFRKGKDRKGNPTDTDFIDGPTIVVASDKVAEPVRVRYMVKPRTAGTMYNEASLPLGVFESK
ncbi:MAG: hypothetical protein IKC14_06590 [Kiritimatiellae bacterium]|nr:hypothetical protein [Kiritimatiellia bacterium]